MHSVDGKRTVFVPNGCFQHVEDGPNRFDSISQSQRNNYRSSLCGCLQLSLQHSTDFPVRNGRVWPSGSQVYDSLYLYAFSCCRYWALGNILCSAFQLRNWLEELKGGVDPVVDITIVDKLLILCTPPLQMPKRLSPMQKHTLRERACNILMWSVGKASVPRIYGTSQAIHLWG